MPRTWRRLLGRKLACCILITPCKVPDTRMTAACAPHGDDLLDGRLGAVPSSVELLELCAAMPEMQCVASPVCLLVGCCHSPPLEPRSLSGASSCSCNEPPFIDRHMIESCDDSRVITWLLSRWQLSMPARLWLRVRYPPVPYSSRAAMLLARLSLHPSRREHPQRASVGQLHSYCSHRIAHPRILSLIELGWRVWTTASQCT